MIHFPCADQIRGRLLARSSFLGVLLLALAVAAATLAPQSARAEEPVHVVAFGESLGAIAKSYNVSVNELIRHNNIGNPDLLVTGQQLRIPGVEAKVEAEAETEGVGLAPAMAALPAVDGYHTVRPGESATGIARSYGLTLEDLLRLNYLDNPNLLSSGQRLRVTARVPALAVDEEPLTHRTATNIHLVAAGETLEEIADEYGTTIRDLLRANGLPNEKMVYPGQRLRIHASAIPAFNGLATGSGRKWIEVNLSTQTLTAWQGDVPVLQTIISSGKAGTPTVTGRFQIGTKYTSQRMYGPGYDIPGVPWVMYFYADYAIHGAYWHNSFGIPMSHGCVNMRPSEAEALWNWAPPGTEVWVHY
jgi:LysM repeat protein